MKVAHSPEKIGIRSEFNFGEKSKVNLQGIFEAFQREGLRDFTEEQFSELISRGEVIAFLS